VNVKLLIDGIVRQTTVLIAQLATSAGMRAPLAHIANQTFLSLTQELERQGIGQKVIADMFGLALRSYQQKVARLSESATDRGSSLWEAVHGYLRTKPVIARADVLLRFSSDDQASVRGILSDLVDSGLAFRTGRGDATVYRLASAEEIAAASSADLSASAEALVWISVYHAGPLAPSKLAELVSLDSATLERALSALVADGRVQCELVGDQPQYRSEQCFIPLGQGVGWEAALLDHYQTVVRAIGVKLTQGKSSAFPADRVGGSTYSFDVWPGHPHAEAVYGLLAEHRKQISGLWSEVAAHNRENARRHGRDRVSFYFGQMVTADTSDAD
jgi:hypothetical protein